MIAFFDLGKSFPFHAIQVQSVIDTAFNIDHRTFVVHQREICLQTFLIASIIPIGQYDGIPAIFDPIDTFTHSMGMLVHIDTPDIGVVW